MLHFSAEFRCISLNRDALRIRYLHNLKTRLNFGPEMGFLRFISGVFSRQGKGSGLEAAVRSVPAAGSVPRLGGDYGMLVSSLGGESAMRVAAVYRCVNFLADAVASLPLRYLRQRDGLFVPDTGRTHFLLNVQPDPALSAMDFWQQVVRHVLLRGNAYVVPVYSPVTMELERLALVDPRSVSHDVYNGLYAVCDTVAGVSGTYSEDGIIHIKNYSVDGRQGISTLSYARITAGIAATGDKETLERFGNGGSVRGLVSNDTSVRGFGEYQDNELRRTAVDLDGRFRSGERIVSLPGQVQFSPISLTSTDMQFLETRKFTVRDICRFFGVHPSFVFDDTSNNYKSAEMANAAFLTNTLNPLLRKIENELLRKLVAPSLWGKRRFEFDRSDMYVADPDSRVRYQKETIAAGLYTVNEWRRKDNRPTVEGGDRVLISANLRAIDSPEISQHITDPSDSGQPDSDNDKENENEE